MLRMCVYMHSRFIKNHLIWILEDRLIISEVVLSQRAMFWCSSLLKNGPGEFPALLWLHRKKDHRVLPTGVAGPPSSGKLQWSHRHDPDFATSLVGRSHLSSL
jgi:hypothetical protein